MMCLDPKFKQPKFSFINNLFSEMGNKFKGRKFCLII